MSFWSGRGERYGRRRFGLSFGASDFGGWRIRGLSLDRLLVILLRTLQRVREMMLCVFRNHDLGTFVLWLPGGRLGRLPFPKQRGLKRPQEKQNVHENAQDSGQLHGSTHRAIVDQTQDHHDRARHDGDHDDPEPTIAIPIGVIKVAIGDDHADEKRGEDRQRHVDGPNLLVERLVRARLDPAHDSPSFRHDSPQSFRRRPL